MSAFVSYAQNGEDFTLWCALHDVDAGTYIDIGAYDPDIDSVTRAFYDRGWSGINIEPVDAYWKRLHRERPRDVNLPLAVGAESGELSHFRAVSFWAVECAATTAPGVAGRDLAS